MTPDEYDYAYSQGLRAALERPVPAAYNPPTALRVVRGPMTMDEAVAQDRRDMVLNVLEQCTERGLKVPQLSEVCEIPERSLRNLITPNGPRPHLYQISKVAYALDVPVSVLMRRRET